MLRYTGHSVWVGSTQTIRSVQIYPRSPRSLVAGKEAGVLKLQGPCPPTCLEDLSLASVEPWRASFLAQTTECNDALVNPLLLLWNLQPTTSSCPSFGGVLGQGFRCHSENRCQTRPRPLTAGSKRPYLLRHCSSLATALPSPRLTDVVKSRTVLSGTALSPRACRSLPDCSSHSVFTGFPRGSHATRTPPADPYMLLPRTTLPSIWHDMIVVIFAKEKHRTGNAGRPTAEHSFPGCLTLSERH
jgi:hypothetical protein